MTELQYHERRAGKGKGYFEKKGEKLTSFLQKHRLICKRPTLMPRHPIPQIIQLNLLTPLTLPHPRRSNLSLPPIRQRHRNHSASSPGAPRLNIRIDIIVLKKATAMRGRRRGLHLHREPGARIHRVTFAEGVRDLVDIDRVESDADADAAALDGVFDEDEFALLGFGEVAEEGCAIVFFRLGARSDGARAVRHGRATVVRAGGHGRASYGRIRGVIAGVSLEDVVLSDVVSGASRLAVRCLVMMVMLFIHIFIVTYKWEH